MITNNRINNIIDEQIQLIKENLINFVKIGDNLYAMGEGPAIIGKKSITWDEFEFGVSQNLIKRGFRIAITGDIDDIK